MTATATPAQRNVLCPTCSEPVTQPPTGRRRTFCSATCRRLMYRQVAELPELERQFAETEVLRLDAHNDSWRMRRERELDWLRLALDEARQRVPEQLRQEIHP